jgi:UDP-N-acetylglucosamine--N-acetylmuramyl-(pentapeptide) pyrophosphoryl-undecaprenol N-acetylglucosamine transferase
MKDPVRIIFAAGGTGGHVYPALAVSDALRARVGDFEALFIGTKAGLEAKVVPEAGHAVKFIHARGFRGRHAARKLFTLVGIAVGVVQAIWIVAAFRPDLVFGAGGYASAAVVLAASMLGRTIVIQEQNAVPGFGLDGHGPVLLVFGGSQGSHSLNRAAVDFFLRRPAVRGILQTGGPDYGWVRDRLRDAKGRVHVSPYIENIHVAYRAADIALARAGALSVSELSAVALPSILVPYPHAADDHQAVNARILARSGGAVVITDDELSGETLASTIDRLLDDPRRLPQMAEALSTVARRDAAERIAEDICALIGAPADRGSEERPGGRGGGGGGC